MRSGHPWRSPPTHPFSEWGQTFADPRLAAAVVDRLTFHAHIIETGSESYRLRVTTSAREVRRQADHDPRRWGQN